MQVARGLRAVDRREGLRQDVATELRKSSADADLDQEVLADATGVDASYVSRMASSRCKDTVTVVDLVAWLLDDECRPVGRSLMRWVADAARLTVSERLSLEGVSSLWQALGDHRDTAHGLHREIDKALDPNGPEGSDLTTGELEAIRERLLRQRECTDGMLTAVDHELRARGERPGLRAVGGGER